MADESPTLAWLETAAGNRVEIVGSCSLGRTTSNQCVLPDDKVSRRHAIVHAQGDGEYWLVDLGSSNGTYLNGRRVTQPVRLQEMDRIEVGPFQIVFRQPSGTPASLPARLPTSDAEKTIHDITSSECWLLVADIASSTLLHRKLSPEELPLVTGRWFDACKRILDAWGGGIDKYLGDGFFAFWPAQQETDGDVARALEELKKFQATANPPFRIVVHYGRVFMGGLATMGGARLFGPEVNFTFRMERLGSSLGVTCLLSNPAAARLKGILPVTSVGNHALPSFPGEVEFHSF